MRNTKDIAEAVFRIRDEHLEQKRLRNNKIKKACAAVSAVSAAVFITGGAVYISNRSAKPGRIPEEVSVISEEDIPASTSAVTDKVTTHTNAAVSSVITSASETTTATAYTTSSAVTSAEKKNNTPAVNTSANSTNASVSSARTETVRTSAETTPAEINTTIVTTAATKNDEEEIRMKVENIKRYLAALSAAALSSSAVTPVANAASAYVPKDYKTDMQYVEWMYENPGIIDFDGNGRFDAFDAYAVHAYIHEKDAVPAETAERCAANGDINNNGEIDDEDTVLLIGHAIKTDDGEDIETYFTGITMNYIVDAENGKYTPSIMYCNRKIGESCPESQKETYLLPYVNESYTYGSDDTIAAFVESFFNYSFMEYDAISHSYESLSYSKFADEIKSRNMSFDVNEDGEEDMKDLFDFYLYDILTCTENDLSKTSIVFSPDDPEATSAISLPIPDEDKEMLLKNCKPWYDLAEEYFTSPQLDGIARYIMTNCELKGDNTHTPYYYSYRGDLTVNERSVVDYFVIDLDSWLSVFFESPNKTSDYSKSQAAMDRYYLTNSDSEYLHDNAKLKALISDVQQKYKDGLLNDVLDINHDGIVDVYDQCSMSIYGSDISNLISAEFSVLPQEQWDHIENNLDLDNDNVAGTIIDELVLSSITGPKLSQYEQDLYFLDLLEKKDLRTASEIEPFLAPLCENKDTGDVDLDGAITAKDASQVLTFFAESSTDKDISPVDEAKMNKLGDFNSDGMIDAKDASSILKTYAKNSVEH